MTCCLGRRCCMRRCGPGETWRKVKCTSRPRIWLGWPAPRNLRAFRGQGVTKRLKRYTDLERHDERIRKESRVGASAGRERSTQEQKHGRAEPQGQREGCRIPIRNGTFSRHALQGTVAPCSLQRSRDRDVHPRERRQTQDEGVARSANTGTISIENWPDALRSLAGIPGLRLET